MTETASPTAVAFLDLADRLNKRARASKRLIDASRGNERIMHLAEMSAILTISTEVLAVAQAMSAGTAETAQQAQGRSPASAVGGADAP